MKRITSIIIFVLGLYFISAGQAYKGMDGKYYDEEGKLFSGVYKEVYHDTVIKTLVEVKNGIPDGLTRIYFENGKLEEVRSFREGMMDGKWERWNMQDKKVAEAFYMGNLKHGKWYIWDDQGVLRYDMTYVKGKKSGTWLMFDENGNLIDQKEY